MPIKRQRSGNHHITAIASSASESHQFYETVLGLRLVKQTVNVDDPYTYHLYYGDGIDYACTMVYEAPQTAGNPHIVS